MLAFKPILVDALLTEKDGINMTRLIFVTGGVVSSLGKGITAASLGAVLVARGLSVTMQKLDPISTLILER